MLNNKLFTWLWLILLTGALGCEDKPTIALSGAPAALEGVDGQEGNSLAGLSIQASISNEDWEKFQVLVQDLLPRIAVLESAIINLSDNSSLIASQNAILIENSILMVENSFAMVRNSFALIEGSDILSRKSDILTEKTEELLCEAKKTTEILGKAFAKAP